MKTPYQIARDEAAKDCPRCAQARIDFAHKFPSLTPSRVVDHGTFFCAEQSVETWGRSTFNHPKGYVQVRIDDARLPAALVEVSA